MVSLNVAKVSVVDYKSSDSVEDFHFKMSQFFHAYNSYGVHNRESLNLSF